MLVLLGKEVNKGGTQVNHVLWLKGRRGVKGASFIAV